MRLYERLRVDESEIGSKHGDWEQVGASFSLPTGGRHRLRYAVCRCKCGTHCVVRCEHMRSGASNGCVNCRPAKVGAKRKTHGMSGTRVFQIWSGMKKRCLNPRCRAFKNYGGRGIKICDRWRESFPAFYADMGEPPTDEHEIDRIDNNGNYEPENCRWVTPQENNRNTRRCVVVNLEGKQVGIKQLSEISGVSENGILWRLHNGWTPEESTEPRDDTKHRRAWATHAAANAAGEDK